jgi:hypothetical protein
MKLDAPILGRSGSMNSQMLEVAEVACGRIYVNESNLPANEG